MKCRATVSFAGKISMVENEVRDVPKKDADELVSCGYLVICEEKKPEKKRESTKE